MRVGTFILSVIRLLMVPPKARSSLGVGGLGPNSASPFFFSSSALAAVGPFAFISFLHAHRNREDKHHEEMEQIKNCTLQILLRTENTLIHRAEKWLCECVCGKNSFLKATIRGKRINI